MTYFSQKLKLLCFPLLLTGVLAEQAFAASETPQGNIVTQSRISASADDAEERESGSVYLNSSDLELVFDKQIQTVGLRFADLSVPANAVISKAYIQFKVDETDFLPDTQLNIVGESTGNALSFDTSDNNISARSKTNASVSWSPAAWNTVGATGSDQRTADLTAIIQEIVSATGWNRGNAMAFILTGAGQRVAEAYDGDRAGAPLLYIEYSTGDAVADSEAPVITLLGSNPVMLNVDDSFSDLGATAFDAIDKDLTSSITSSSDLDTSVAGNYAVTYTVTDSSGNVSEATRTVVVNKQTSERYSVQKRISASADDAEENTGGRVYLKSSDLELLFDRKIQTVGLRFSDLSIPENSFITKAYIQFKVDETDFLPDTKLNIAAENTDNALSFDSSDYNISSRNKTNSSVTWSPSAWSTVGATGSEQRTADLTAIVQEIVSETGWNSGNAIAFIFSGAGKRVAEAYDGDPAGAPLLYVEYTNNAESVPPTIEFISPIDGSKVSGVIDLQVNAQDDSGIASVQYQWDSRNIGSPVSEAPFNLMWDTSEIGDGFFTLTAIATDLDGNTTKSNFAVVQIANQVSAEVAPTPLPLPAEGKTLNVPEQYATVQSAVDAARSGDMVLLAPGTYSGGIHVFAQGITIASRFIQSGDANDLKNTIIKGGTPVILIDGSAGNSRIIGLTIKNGTKGVQCYVFCEVFNNFFDNVGSDAMSLENTGGNIIANEFIGSGDDAIDLDGPGETLVAENKIQDCGDDGMEMRNFNYSGATINVVIRNNSIDNVGEDGLQLIDYPANSDRIFTFENNLITNSEDAGIGLMADGNTVEDFSAASVQERVYVFNNTIVGNKVGLSGGDNLVAVNNIFVNSSIYAIKGVNGKSIAAYNLYSNTNGNVSNSNVTQGTMLNADPKFGPAYNLQADSPAIDSGTQAFVFEGKTVLTRSGFLGKNPDLGSIESR